MKIDESSFEILGTYYFSNESDKNFLHSIYYPFLIDSVTCFPDSVSIADTAGRKIEFIKRKRGVSIPVSINIGDTLVYKIYYRQKIVSNKAEYILTTTESWNKPLNFAEYIIIVPEHLTVEYIYPKPDEKEKQNKNVIYKSARWNFVPNENLKVVWGQI